MLKTISEIYLLKLSFNEQIGRIKRIILMLMFLITYTIVINRVTENSVSTIKFYRVFLKYMKEEVKIYILNVTKKLLKHLLFLL